ncbi:MAG: flagellar hook-length control protein FliK [Roseomonas sp.]|nr:flagellar hook-length control protein FliK [Roseomonas sp.]MCA3320401.1 flagellar hook-length control protein FliK [Roseomonas sp.]
MLEPAAAPPPKPAASQTAGNSARPVQKEAAGFQDKLRDALDSAPEEAWQAPNADTAGKATERQDRNQAESKSVNSRQDATRGDFGAPETASQAASPADGLAEPAAEPVAPVVEDASGTLVDQEAAAQMALAQAEILAQAEMPTGLAGLQSAVIVPAAQTLAGQPGAAVQLGITGSGEQANPASVMIATEKDAVQGLVPPMEDPSAAATLAAAGTAQASQAEITAISAGQQGMALKAAPGIPDITADQQHNLINALAAGSAQAAAQMAPSPQATGGPAKPAPIALTKEALDTARNTEALSLLAKAINTTEAVGEVKLVMATETVTASSHLASLEAPKASNAKASGEGRVDGLAMPPSGFALVDGVLQRIDAPAPSSVARELPAPPARQLAPVVVSLALGRGDEALTIALDPGELGRVEVSIGQGKEAGQVRIVAERPETLALLQRDQRDLDRALNQAGLGDMARSLSFSLASDQGRQQHHGSAHERGHRASMIVSGLDGDRAMPALPSPTRNATSLIDIAV